MNFLKVKEVTEEKQLGEVTLRPASIEFHNNIIQLEHEIALMQSLPEMKSVLNNQKKELAEQKKYLTAVEAGFDPFFPPSVGTWYQGFLVDPKKNADYRVWNRALPAFVIEAYQRAKELGIFATYTVHSTEIGAFVEKHSTPTFMDRLSSIDPLLVGWTDLFVGSSRHWSDRACRPAGRAFLIAQWDMAKDLRAAGVLQLPSGK